MVSGTPTVAGVFQAVLRASNLGGDSTATVTFTVVATPVVSVSVLGSGVALVGRTTGEINLTRVGDVSGQVAVRYKVKGSAVAGTDFEPLTGVTTLPAGFEKTKVKIKPINDRAKASTHVVKLKLLPSQDGSYVLGTATTAKIKIIDND